MSARSHTAVTCRQPGSLARGLRLGSAVLVLLLALIGLGQGHAQAARQKLAVLGIEADDAAGAKLAGWITEGLRARATKAQARYELPASGKRDLAEVKLLSDCLDEKLDCMAAIGRELGVERLIYGKLSKGKAGGYVLTLKILDVPGKKFERPLLSKELSAAEATEDGAKKLATTAFVEITGAVSGGSIEIQANADQGTVYVDGTMRGAISGRAATVGDLPEGMYTVEIEAPGKKRYSTQVTVRAGEPSVVVANLEDESPGAQTPEDPPLVPPPHDEPPTTERPGGGYRVAFWTSLALTAGGAAAFTITGVKVRSLEDDKAAAIVSAGNMFEAGPNEDACAKADAQGYAPVSSICDDGKRYATLTNVFIGVTAVAAVAAGFFYYKGYIASQPPSKKDPATTRRRGRGVAGAGQVTITPQFGPNGAGLGATITF